MEHMREVKTMRKATSFHPDVLWIGLFVILAAYGCGSSGSAKSATDVMDAADAKSEADVLAETSESDLGDPASDVTDSNAPTDTTDRVDVNLALCGVDDDEKTHLPLAIYGGTTVPELFSISPAQQKAVVAIIDLGGTFCTGTLISPFVVLTAGHCFDDLNNPDEAMIVIGADTTSPEATLAISAFYVHPDYAPYGSTAMNDLTVVVLKASATLAVDNLVPIPISTEPVDADMIGTEVQNSGYGVTDEEYWNTKRFWVAEPIHEVQVGDFAVNGSGVHGICFGDSGGPSLYDDGFGLRVLGVVSYGDESCVDIDHFADVGIAATWINGYVQDSLTCGAVDEGGLCDGSIARWCADGLMTSQDCSSLDQVCGRDESSQYRCIPDPCQGITRQGVCQGEDVAVWCEDGVLHQRHCRPCNQVCGFASNDLGYYCIDASL